MGNQSDRAVAHQLRVELDEGTLETIRQASREAGFRRGLKPFVERLLRRFADRRRQEQAQV
jgi:hypothetical protein